MPKTWDELIPFYQELETEDWWRDGLASMKKLIRLIVENRDVSKLRPGTSHATLCLTKHDPHAEWKGKPYLYIEPASIVS